MSASRGRYPLGIRFAVRLYMVATHVFPPEFRRRFGDDLVATFHDDLRAIRPAEPWRLLVVTARAVRDAIHQGAIERLEQSGLKRRTRTGGRVSLPPPAPPGLLTMLEDVVRDCRYALRTLARARLFTGVVVVTLALGIAAVTAVFTAVNAIVLRPLPYPDAEDLVMVWEPFDVDPAAYSRGSRLIVTLGRLAPGVSLEQAQADMTRIASRLEADYPDTNRDVLARVVPLHDEILGGLDRQLYLLLGAVAFVFLITVVNVANLMIARGVSRQEEMALRSALGGGRSRIVCQLLAESLLLGIFGGAAAVLAAGAALELLVAAAPAGIPRLDEVSLDGTALAFAAAISLVAGLACGLLPALQVRSGSEGDALRSTRGHTGRRGRSARRVLVAVQVAVALVLLIGSGLLIHSLVRLLGEDPGFDAGGVVAARVRLGSRYDGTAPQGRFFADLLERLAARAELEQASAVFLTPFSGGSVGGSFEIVGRPAPAGEDGPSASLQIVSEGFFDMLRIPVRAGRELSADDGDSAEPVALINEAAARLYWPGENPLDTMLRIQVSLDDQEPDIPRRIVGIVADTRHRRLDETPQPFIYAPFRQRPTESMYVLLRTAAGSAGGGGRVLRAVLTEMDPDLAIDRISTLSDMIGSTVASDRFAATLLSVFAAIALLLGCVGVYGVVAYGVSARTGEFGVRIALGARGGDIGRLVLRDTLAVAAAGLGAGLVASLALTRFLEGMLHEVSVTDPAVFGLMSALLLGAALAAAAIPARRAARTDPLAALRAE